MKTLFSAFMLGLRKELISSIPSITALLNLHCCLSSLLLRLYIPESVNSELPPTLHNFFNKNLLVLLKNKAEGAIEQLDVTKKQQEELVKEKTQGHASSRLWFCEDWANTSANSRVPVTKILVFFLLPFPLRSTENKDLQLYIIQCLFCS